MASIHRVIIRSPLDATKLSKLVRPSLKSPRRSIARIATFLVGLANGAHKLTSVELATGTAAAVGLITFTDQPVAGETVIVAGVTFTARASGAVADEWNLTSGGTAAADAAGNAASVAALINTHASLSLFLSAVQVLGVVTVTCLVPGAVGNGLVIAEGSGGLTNATVTTFANGSDGTKTLLAA